MRAPAADDPRAVGERDLRGAVLGGVVGDPELGAGEGRGERVETGADPVGLVAGGDYHEQIRSSVRSRADILPPAMADVEAHITGTVWKIEVAVGDDVADGDTVVILESMKMEMPVEVEDDGMVKEIRCEEGQSVQEGDVLVVLE